MLFKAPSWVSVSQMPYYFYMDSKDSPQGAAGSCTSGSPASMTLAVEIDKKSSTLTFRQEPFFGDLEVLDDLQNVKVTLPNQPIRSN